jgi:signal transduction histidine kinase
MDYSPSLRRGSRKGAIELVQKFAAMSRMAGSVAHDFNNILTGILGNLELLERRAAKLGIADFADYLKGARSAANRGVDVTQRLLAVSGHQLLEPRELPAGAALDGMAELLQACLGPAIRLEIAHEPDIWPIFADPAQFEESLLSLARNARDAMPGGGLVRITGRNEPLDAAAAAALELQAGDYVAVAVRDSGPGMSHEAAARAFEPFFTTKSSGAGTGLGLAIVMGFIRQSGGQAKIEVLRPGGTEVTLLLPRFTA